MAPRNGRTAEEVRRDIAAEREQLSDVVDALRGGIGVKETVRAKLPVLTAGALGAGVFLAGGICATMRLLMRRSREGRTKAKLGRFTLVDRD